MIFAEGGNQSSSVIDHFSAHRYHTALFHVDWSEQETVDVALSYTIKTIFLLACRNTGHGMALDLVD